MDNSAFLLGEWHVSPSKNSLTKGKLQRVVEPKAMDVLLFMCQSPGEVLSADEIVHACWPNTELGDNPLHKSVTQLRKALGDKASAPQYIETIRKRGYRVIANVVIQETTAQETSIAWQSGSPFAGLKAFSVEQADIFFGRDRQINQLLERLSQQVKQNVAFTLILGASGSGKTSLVQAGLLPRLLNANHVSGISVVSEVFFDCGGLDTDNLWLDFASYLLDWELEGQLVFADMSPADIAAQLQNGAQDLIALCSALTTAYSDTKDILYPRLFLTIDRLEVLLDSPNFTQDTRNRFIKLIDNFARSNAIIVIATCRNDFYPLISHYPALIQNKEKGAHFDLLPPQATDIIQMIRLPAIAAGLQWEYDNNTHRSLDEIIANDANNTPDALPLLQYSLNELYQQRQGVDLTFSAYTKLGGIEGAIGNQAEAIVATLSETHQQALEALFAKLITLNKDGSNLTSKSVPWDELTAQTQRDVAQILVDNRLFVSDLEQTKPSFRLAHEALIRRWSRIQQWVETHKHSLIVANKVQQATRSWLSEQRNSEYLLAKGKPLNEAIELQLNPCISLTEYEQAFIQASQHKQGKQQRVRQATLVALAVLTFLSCLLTAVSFNALTVAETKRDEAEDLLGFMVGDFADKLRSVKRMDLLDGINQKATEYFATQQHSPLFKWFTSDKQWFQQQFKKAQTISAIAEVDYTRGKNNDAKTGLIEAQYIFDALYSDYPANLSLLKAMGANAFWQGQIAYDLGELDIAEKMFSQYLSHSQSMLEINPTSLDALIEVSDSLSSLGSLYFQSQDYEKANQIFLQSLKITDELLLQLPNDEQLLLDQIEVNTWLGEINFNLAQIDQARNFYELALSQAQAIDSATPNNADVLDLIHSSYQGIANYYSLLGHYSESKKYYLKAADILATLRLQDPGNTLWSRQHLEIRAISLFLTAKMQLANHLDEIENQALEISQLAVETASKNINALLFITEYWQLTGSWHQSANILNTLSPIFNELLKQKTISPQNGRHIARYYMLLAKHSSNNRTIPKQQENCVKAIKVLAPIIKTNKHPARQRINVQAHDCINRLDLVSNQKQALDTLGIAEYTFHNKEK